MANLNGDGVVECGEGCGSGNSRVMPEESEMEVGKKAHSEAVESRKGCKRGSSNSVAEESDNDLEGKKKKMKKAHECGDGRSFFDCNICLDMAREPVVTYCGHLFCWACFYKLRYVDSTAKATECPVCRGEVTDSAIIPIYGNRESIVETDSESGTSMIIPPRPKGQRAERAKRPVSQLPVPGAADGEALQAEARVGSSNSGTSYQNLPETSRVRDRSRYIRTWGFMPRLIPNPYP